MKDVSNPGITAASVYYYRAANDFLKWTLIYTCNVDPTWALPNIFSGKTTGQKKPNNNIIPRMASQEQR